MSPSTCTFILTLSIIFFSTTTISAFNITRLLDNHPSFSTFNELLTKTGVAGAINSRRTITVLVVDNAGMKPVTSEPQGTIKSILATHVLLDYYDTNKIGDMSKKTSQLTTLFQSSGTAQGQQGYINITNSGGTAVFKSSAKGNQQGSIMVKSVAAQPYNISVIQIDQPISIPGLFKPPPMSPSSSPKISPNTAPPPKVTKTPTSAPSPAPTPDAESPDDDVADGPDTEAPSPTPIPAPAPAPDEADTADQAPAKLAHKAGARMNNVSGGGIVVAIIMGLSALAI